jgi:REP element-mobilizing transposase RayT
MARPPRLEFPGALYHVTSRGNARQKIFLDPEDRHLFLDLFGKEVAQQGLRCYAYCLMDNHYHLLIETPEPTLVSGMRRLNGVYARISSPRVSQIHAGIEKDKLLEPLKGLINFNKVMACPLLLCTDHDPQCYGGRCRLARTSLHPIGGG